LIFTPKGEPQKGFLRLPELFNLDFAAEMVTLSACQTGLGNSQPGEGLVGMTRGLMYAGAKRVTVSLWDVPDIETAQLMQQFYRNLFDTKMSHSAALRSAQLQLFKEGKHPYFWAAFELQGEWRN
jgi:CHAT domain-containing protein